MAISGELDLWARAGVILGRTMAEGVLYKAGFNLARCEQFAFAASVENGATTLWSDDLGYMEAEGVDILRRKVGDGEWTEILRTLGYITAIAIDPQDPDRVTVGYTRFRSNSSQGRPIDGGFVRTTDGGATWQPSLATLDAPPIFSVVFDPLDSQHVVAGPSAGSSRAWTTARPGARSARACRPRGSSRWRSTGRTRSLPAPGGACTS